MEGSRIKVGSKIRYTGSTPTQITWNKNDDPDKKGMEIGEIYIVSKVEIHSWHTKISIKGIEGKFNSVCFEVVE